MFPPFVLADVQEATSRTPSEQREVSGGAREPRLHLEELLGSLNRKELGGIYRRVTSPVDAEDSTWESGGFV